MQDARTHIHPTDGRREADAVPTAALLALVLVVCVAVTVLIARGEEGSSPSAVASWPASRPGGGGSPDAPVAASVDVPPAVVIRLLPEAVVVDDRILLRDIAELQGPPAETWGAWSVGDAPGAGESRTLSASQVEALLESRNVNLGHCEIRGARQCRVSRPAKMNSTGAAASVPTTESTFRSPDELRPEDLPPLIDDGSLESAVRDHLTRRAAGLEGQVLVQFSPSARQLLSLRRPPYEFRIECRSDRLIGLLSLDVQILENGRPRQNVPLLVQVSLRKKVVVAANPINRHQTIAATHLTLTERTFDRVEDIGLTRTEPVIGQRARRFLAAGEMLLPRDLEAAPLVERNDPVTVWIRRGGVTVRAAAKALTAGTWGQTVQLRQEASREVFEAVVIGPRTVEIRTGPSTRPVVVAEGGG